VAKILRSVYVDRDQLNRLKRLSTETRIPQAVYIREGLELLLEKHESKAEHKRENEI